MRRRRRRMEEASSFPAGCYEGRRTIGNVGRPPFLWIHRFI